MDNGGDAAPRPPPPPGTPPGVASTGVPSERRASNVNAGPERAHSLGVPPPRSPGNEGRPPLPHLRGQSAQSQVSDVSFDTSLGPWDAKIVEGILEQQASTSNGGLETPSSKVGRRLTLTDIKEASPIEAEAETLLLRALEEREERPEMENAVLPHVPDAFEAEPVEPPLSGSGELRFQAAADQVRSSQTGTKGKLVGLTQAMRLLHEDTAGTQTVEQPEHLPVDSALLAEPVEQEVPSSDTDTFLNNANLLFRRTSKEADCKEAVMNSLSATDSGAFPSTPGDVEHGASSPSEDSHGKHSSKSCIKQMVAETEHGLKDEIRVLRDFLEPRKASIFTYSKWMMLAFILPLTIIAIILFYGVGNPYLRDTGASISWLMLFLVRNLITFSLGKATEVFVIDFLSLRIRFTVKVRPALWCLEAK